MITFNISSKLLHKKYADLFNGGLSQKFLAPFLRGIYVLSVGFKMKPLQISVFLF